MFTSITQRSIQLITFHSTFISHLKCISHHFNGLTRPALTLVLLGSTYLIGCGNFSEPSHFIQDNISDDMVSLELDGLTGRYLTESTVRFEIMSNESYFDRGLSITSSDSRLLRAAESSDLDTASLEDYDGYHVQYFDVLAPGKVTLTFRDGDEVILQREVELVEASSLEVTRNTNHSFYPQDVDKVAGQGEKVIINNRQTLHLSAQFLKGTSEEEIDFSNLIELNDGEGYTIHQNDMAFMKGLNLTLTFDQEGFFTVPVKVGGKQLDLNFEVVSENQIESLSVTSNQIDQDQYVDEEGKIFEGMAIALAKDAEGSPILGANFSWARLDNNNYNEIERHYGDRLNFEYQEGAQVPFKVSAGNHSEIVYIPMNPDSNLIFVDSAFDEFCGCDANGNRSTQTPILLLLIGLIAFRRRFIAS